VVTSPYWSGGGTASVGKGAVTWGDGSAGTTGAVSSTNSLVGTRTTDLVGLRGVVALSNSNYVVVSSDWGNGSLLKQGAVTWGNGAGGTVGEVSTANSLIGEKAYTFLGGISYGSAADYLFNPITELAGGQYFVLSSPYWNTNAGTSATSTGNMGKGAVTRLPTASASVKDTFGFIGATNSLVGTTAADHIGRGFDDKTGVVALTGNHTFVVASPYWNNGVASNNVGAVTWVGPSGLVGPVSTSNSLHGTSAQDRVGSTKVSALPNGHYVVSSRLWTGGAGSTANLGAVTWGDGTSGITGPVDANNSLVGSTSGDQVGDQIVVLNNGNYVVGSPFWNNGAVADVGAVTLGIGSTAGPRTVGAVSASNSLVGTTTNDRVGTTIFALPQSSTTSNYVVLSSSWDRDYAIDTGSGTGLEGVVANAGAATWGSGTTGVTGPVSISNSLIGSTASDAVGNTSASFSYFKALSNGNYVLVTPNWNRGALADVGAVTWGSGTSGVTGEISSSNSLLGTLASDKIGSYGVETLRLGNYIVLSPEKNVASTTYNGGAITWGPGSTALTGDIGVYNSFLGGGTVSYTDQLGTGGVLALSDGRALVLSHFGRMGGVSNAGRMDIISYAIPPTLSDAGVFANSASSSQQVAALDIKASMDAGTPVTLQASNDITVSSAITGTNTAGHLTLQAGRSILVNANITTGGANLTLKANEPLSAGVVDAQRDAGAAVVTMASGTTINAGSGNLTVSLGTGAGLTNSTSGDITLRTITAANVSVTNAGTTSGSSITTNNNITAATSVSLEARSGSVTVASGSSNLLAGAGAVSIRARDDITINAALTSPAGSTGGLSMLAGRSVLINQAIQTQNGPITIKANHSDSTDAVSDSRLPGTAVITTAATPTTVTLSAGTGAVDIRIMNGAGLTTTDASAITSGAITLPPNQVTGGDVTVINDGPTLGTSNIASTSNITAKGNVLIKANTGSISIAGISTDGSVTSGAAVSLLAMDDITNTTRAIDNSSANGAVTLKAGRSINLTQNIVAPGGVTVSANTPYDASSGVSASRTAGAASLSVTSSIRATALSNMSVNNGNVSIELANGAGLADSTTGSLAVGAVFGRNINITHNGTSGTGITLSGSLAAYGLYNGSNVRQSVGATNITANNGSILVSANATYQGSGGNTFTMRARDDITLNSVLIDRQLTNGSDPDLGGLVQILAGRSVLFNSEFRTSGSPLTINANHYDNTSTVSATRLPGAAVITMGGTLGSIRTTGTAAPHGSVTIELMNGTGLSTTDSSAIASGNITLQSIPNANNLTVTNNGPTPGSGIVVAASGLGIGATGGTTGPTRIGPITGLINLSTRNGDINLQGNIATSSTASGAITLVAGTAASAPTSTGGDVILTGTRTLTTGAGGSTFLFSGSAANSTGVTALATSARTFYNVDPANMPGSGITSDVHAFYRQNTLPLTLTLDNTSMVYGDSFPTLPSFTLTGGTFNTGDSITSMAWGSAATAFMAQGTYPYSTSNLITPTFACAAAGCAANYSLTFVNGLTISPRPITITADAKSMTYGGTAPALTHQITAGTLVNNDAFTGALSRAAGIRAGTYAINQNNLSYGSNYAVTYVPANFTINPAVLTISMTNTGVTKPYDGSNAAPAGFTPILSVSGLIANDSAAALSDTGSTYNDAHVAAANKVTVSGLAISGITGSNGSLPSDYVLSANSTFVPATITPVPVTVSSASIGGTLTKAYDGTTAATGATVSGAVSGGIAGDTLNLSASGMTLAYSSPRAGTRTISASGTPSLVITNSSSGSLPSDYSYTAPVIADVSGTITPKALSATASIGGTLSKVYDGSAAAPGALVSGAVSGAVAGDAISVNTGAISVSYNSARVVGANSLRASGTPAVVIDSSTSGSVLSDYSFTAPVIADVSGTITPKLLVSSLTNTNVSKPFDGTVSTPSGFEPQFSVSGLIGGDTFASLSGTASFNTADPQTANAVVVSSLAISRIDGSNGSVPTDYRLDSSEKFVSAKIIQQPLFLPALIQTSTTATTVTSSQNIESRKENVLIAERVAVSAVSTAPAPQFKLAAVLNFGDADVGMDLLVTPNSSSLTLAQSTTSEGSSKENAEVKTNTIDLFTQTGTTVAAGGALSIVEQGRSLSASNLSTSSSAPSDINLTGMRFVNVDYSVPSGGKNQISVGVSSDGVLVVKVPSAMKAASDDRSLALIGMATAKARLDVQPANVKGVVIQVE
jgi:hypothetical protein